MTWLPPGQRVQWHQIVPGLEEIPTDIVPNADATHDLGTSTERWGTAYFGFIDLNQGAADTPIVIMRSSDVAHGATHLVDANVFGYLAKLDAALGGLSVAGFAEDDVSEPVGIALASVTGRNDTAKSTAGRASVEVQVIQHDGAGATEDVDADGNVFGVRARRGGSTVTVLLVDEDGDLWFDGKLSSEGGGVALGGGSTATLGTIGGSGPTAAGQAQWLEVVIGGTTHWIPAWT